MFSVIPRRELLHWTGLDWCFKDDLCTAHGQLRDSTDRCLPDSRVGFAQLLQGFSYVYACHDVIEFYT